MIDYHPIKTLEVGSLEIKVWGLIFALAVTIGLTWVYFRSKTETQKDKVLNIAIISLLGGIIGSRLAYVILYSESINSILEVFKVWQGGMVSYGGFILGGFLSFIYLKTRKLNFYEYLDLFAPPLALSIAITRIGCFLNHCHLGEKTNLPWALNYLGETRHPIALYYALSALIIMIVLIIIEKYTSKKGLIGLSFLTLYPIGRAISDLFAFYQPQKIATLNYSLLGLTFILGLALLIKKTRKL
jgi:phosphatidylglycerol:prolipoprotein diacylglycerol transferase